MKSLLIRLTHGLSELDISQDELKTVEELFNKKYLTKKDKKYKFHSKYRAGTIELAQGSSAYLTVIGEQTHDLFIEDILNAKEGDLVIAQRLLGKRGKPSGKIIEVIGRAESYSIGYILEKESKKSLVDLKTEHPAGVELTQEELNSYEVGEVFKINNQDGTIMESLGNINDPKVDEKIVLAQYNKHDEFDEE